MAQDEAALAFIEGWSQLPSTQQVRMGMLMLRDSVGTGEPFVVRRAACGVRRAACRLTRFIESQESVLKQINETNQIAIKHLRWNGFQELVLSKHTVPAPFLA